MVSRQGYNIAAYGSIIPPILFWGSIMAMGLLLLSQVPETNYNIVITIVGAVLSAMGIMFIIGVIYYNMSTKKDFGDVNDLV